MFHEPAVQESKNPAAKFKARLGLRLFAVYALFYGAFVAIALYDVTLMEAKLLFGLNLATVYGFALILFAVLLSLVYDFVSTRKERELARKD